MHLSEAANGVAEPVKKSLELCNRDLDFLIAETVKRGKDYPTNGRRKEREKSHLGIVQRV